MSRSPPSSLPRNAALDAFINALDVAAIAQVALDARRNSLRSFLSEEQLASLEHLSCTVVTPPRSGAYNVAYEVQFSDATSWIFRIPVEEWRPVDARSMRLDILAMEYIRSRTSVPIPAIHAYSCDIDNPLRHPYMIMDMVHGRLLSEVWHDATWWTGERQKAKLFESLAGFMAELAGLEFDHIGRLDRVEPDGPYFVSQFPSVSDLFAEGEYGPDVEFGPFCSTREYLTAQLNVRRTKDDNPMLAFLQMLLSALLEPQWDAAPFCLGHPDFNRHNIFVDDTGRVVGIIDWDGVFVGPRQIQALTYPLWLFLDWDTLMYGMGDSELYPGTTRDSLEDHRKFRQMYTDAIGAASGGRLAPVTRNSHIVQTLQMAITNEVVTGTNALHLGTFVFGSFSLACDVMEAIGHSGWYTTKPGEIAEVELWESDLRRLETGDYDGEDLQDSMTPQSATSAGEESVVGDEHQAMSRHSTSAIQADTGECGTTDDSLTATVQLL
ncbi:kinase-like protein [Lenzites betulinus]|nr:kinase-like protein [Lenzites betulinus]